MNSMALLALFVWVGVPLIALLVGVLLWRRSSMPMWRWAAMGVTVAILFVPALISNGVKTHFDRQVREMCSEDGGVRVYEAVRLTKERFDELGNIRIPIKKDAQPGDEYFYEWYVHQYRDGNPSIGRDHFLIFRRSDMKLLSEAVSYARLGGDVPGPWIESSYRCPKESSNPDLIRLTFIPQKGDEK